MRRIRLAMLLCSAITASRSLATEPGEAVSPTHVEEVAAALFVGAVRTQHGRLSGVQLVWMPPLMVPPCMGKSLPECEKLDHARRLEKPMNAPRTEKPTRMLTEWVSAGTPYGETGRALLDRLASMPQVKSRLAETASGDAPDPASILIKPEFSLIASIRWEVWPNGENFTLRSLGNASSRKR